MKKLLDTKSPIPLYYQLKTIIEDHISRGSWKPGERVPSESELVDKFHVSRTTVRLALADLVNQGLLSRAQGKGTFVSQPRIQQGLSQLTSFSQDMQARGMQPSSRIIRLERTPAPAWVANGLGIAPGQTAIVICRLRLADDTPMAIETSYLLYPTCAAVLEEDLANHSLYQILAHKVQIKPARASQQLEAVGCPPDEARLLKIVKNCPVLRIVRTTYDQGMRPFERTESYYRGDRYVFYTELSE